MDAPHGYVRLLATKQGLGYLHPHTLPFDFVIDEIAHDFTDEYEDDENDIDDLTVVDHKMAANQPRVPAGSSAGGQFGSTGGGGAGGGAGGGTEVTSASESQSSASGVTSFDDLKARYEAEAPEVTTGGYFSDTYKEPITVTDVTLEVYRAGSAADSPRGIFFASDKAGADSYQVLHEGSVTKKYMVTVDKVLVAGHQNTVTQFLFKKTYQDLQYQMQRKYGSEGADVANRAFDKKIMGAAKKLGFKGIVYTRPAPPAKAELHLFSSKGLLEIKMAANQPRVPAGSSAGGQFGSAGGGAASGGAGGGGESSVDDAVQKLNALPLAGEGYRHFSNRDGPEIRMTEFGLHETPEGLRLYSPWIPDKVVVDKIKTEMVLDPSTMDIRYAQSSVVRAAVERKIRGTDTGLRVDTANPDVVKEDGVYYLQGGHHRAAASIMLTGTFKADVIEAKGRDKRGKRIWGKVEPATKMAANQPRVPAGSSAGGQFGSTGGAAGGGSAGAGGQTDTAEFKAWFGDSKVVDADGNPQVVYHGGGPHEGFDHEFIGAANMFGPGFYFSNDPAIADEFTGMQQGAIKPVFISIQNPMVIDWRAKVGEKLPVATIESLVKSSPYANPSSPQSASQQANTAKFVKDAITQYPNLDNYDAFALIGKQFYGQQFNDSTNHFESYLTKFTAATGYDGVIVKGPNTGRGTARVVVAFQPQQIKSSIGNSGAFDPTSRDITKMAANQPRVPAGSSAGGQFGSTGGGAGGGTAGGAGKQTDTAEFKAWFGDSKVVDADGNPVVVFHGTHKPIGATESPQDKSGIFFSSDADVANAYAVRFGNSLDGGEAYDKLRAKLIAQGVDKNEVQTAPEWQALQAITRIEGSQVAPVYLKISNPLVLDGNKAADAATTNRIKDSPAEHAKLKAQGYDGMIIHNVIDRPVIAYTAADAQLANKKASVFVVFSTTQIKSSIGNSGAFDPTSRDITKMAANQPRVPAGSSAGGQFGSTGGTAASGGAGGGMAASEALLTPTTGHYEMAPDRTVSPGNEAAVAYGKANSTLQEGENEGLVSPEIVALSDYVGSGYSETNNLIRANDGLYENLTGPMEASYLSLPREANGFVVGFNSSHTEATSILEDSIRTTYRNGLLEYKGSSRTIDASESAQALQHTGALARLVDNAPALQPTVVYRGVGGNSPGVRLTDMQEALNSGGTVKLNGFTSTSLNPHVAHDFSDNNDRSYVVAIVTRRGLVVNGGPTAGVLGESEVIIPHGTTFKVHAILPAAPGTFYRNKPVVQMIQVDAPATKMAANQPRVPAGSSAGGQFGSTSGSGAGAAGGGAEGSGGGTTEPTQITDEAEIEQAHREVEAWPNDGSYEQNMARELGLASLSDALAGDMLPAMTYVKRDANGKVVGVSQIDGESNARVTVIYLAVSPANQGQGLGRQMMAHAAEIAVDQGKGITLSPTGTAVPFYKKLGMKLAPVGARDEGTMSFSMMQAKDFYMRNAQKAARDILNAEIDSLEPISGLFAKPTTPATKMAANQPRVPAGSSAGGQFGSTSGAAAGDGIRQSGVAGAEVTLMHGTSYGSGLKILEEGFLPGEGGFVYATPKRDIAVQYGFSQAQREAIRLNFEDPNAKFAVVTLKTSIQGFKIDNPSEFTINDTWQWTRHGPVLPSEILRVEVFSAWDLTKPVEILLPKSLPATKQTPAIRTLFAVVMLRGN